MAKVRLEYYTFPIVNKSLAYLDERLNEAAGEGWKVVSVLPYDVTTNMVLVICSRSIKKGEDG